MEDFVRLDVEEKDIQEKLSRELSKNKPFSRFKDALYDYPEIQTKFYLFKDERIKKCVIERLKGHGIELVIESRS